MISDLYRFEIGRESVLFFKQTDSPLILNWMPLNSIYIGVELANFYNIVLKYQNPGQAYRIGKVQCISLGNCSLYFQEI